MIVFLFLNKIDGFFSNVLVEVNDKPTETRENINTELRQVPCFKLCCQVLITLLGISIKTGDNLMFLMLMYIIVIFGSEYILVNTSLT